MTLFLDINPHHFYFFLYAAFFFVSVSLQGKFFCAYIAIVFGLLISMKVNRVASHFSFVGYLIIIGVLPSFKELYIMQNKLSKLFISVLLASMSSLACADDAKKQKYFSKFDLDNNNHLSLEEYSSMLKVRFEKNDMSGWEKQASKRMGFKDANADGQLSFGEWQQSR